MRSTVYLFVALMLLTKPLLANTQQLLQLIDYVGVDYSSAVTDGQISNQAEYAEMLDFSTGIIQQLADLPEHGVKNGLIDNAQLLLQMVEQKASADKIRKLTATMHKQIRDAYQVIVVPRKPPSMIIARQLYSQRCASCHGADGFGDGPAAAGKGVCYE